MSACASATASARRAAAALAVAVAVALAAPRAAAADTVEACATASEEAQVQRDHGKLRAARDLLLQCAAEECPKVVRQDCADWLEKLDREIPSIVPRVRDADGRDRVDVRVLVDGVEVAKSLDGRALPVDPGERRLRFEPAGGAPVEQTVVVRVGEQGRAVDVSLAGPKPAPARAPAAPATPPAGGDASGLRIPVASWILGGVAVVGGGAFAILGSSAKGEVDEMRETCAPGCDPARVDAARRDALVANVALGVGAAALAGAVVLVIVAQPAAAGSGKARRPGARVELGLGGAAGPGVSVGGRF